MTIQVGEQIPSVTLYTKTGGEISSIKSPDLFIDRKVRVDGCVK